MPGVRSNPGEGDPVPYSPYFFRISCYAVSANDVPQVLNLRLQESALRKFQLQTGTSESFKNLPQAADVRLEVWGDHDDVIEVDQQCLPAESAEDLLHMSLKGGRSGGQPKRQHLPLP